MNTANLHRAALACLLEADPDAKCHCTDTTRAAILAGQLQPAPVTLEDVSAAGRPSRPLLVSPRDLPRRRLNDRSGHAALIHAIAHIEFNAINLAWDAVYRFQAMPRDYYVDWSRVAAEEASHFLMLREHLRQLGYDYGAFDAHNGLWEMAQKTAHDVMVRMALVPRVLEARGLDVTPGMVERLTSLGDQRAVQILDVIFREEIGHVEIGTRWFRYLCKQRGVDPEQTFTDLLRQYMRGIVRGPFETAARMQAGFTESEMNMLEEFSLEK
ncbi:MAG: ferritin-like domain-containing protein [Granulosicoccaceae bacterium]|jgi:uncharacterized ferritin-like protein (DUF455 family)